MTLRSALGHMFSEVSLCSILIVGDRPLRVARHLRDGQPTIYQSLFIQARIALKRELLEHGVEQQTFRRRWRQARSARLDDRSILDTGRSNCQMAGCAGDCLMPDIVNSATDRRWRQSLQTCRSVWPDT